MLLDFSRIAGVLREHRINVTDLAAISILFEQGAKTADELREATGLSVPANYALLTRIGERGLVRMEKTDTKWNVQKWEATRKAGQILQAATESLFGE